MTNQKREEKSVFKEQNKLYEFPYHHIPHFDSDGIGTNHRRLDWGFEYLCLLKHAKETIEKLNVRSVLDVGCGDGAFLKMLDASLDIKGVDLSEEAIHFATGFNKGHADVQQLDASKVKDEYDVVTALEVLEHVPDHAVEGFLQTLIDRTKSGGYIYITVPSTNLPLNKKHYRHYDFALFEEHLHSFSDRIYAVSLDYYYRDVWWFKYYKRLCNNRFFTGEFHPLRRALWKQTWRLATEVDETNGYHIVALYRKK